MKLSAFHALCKREWENGHGDIESLHLTDASLKELSDDVIMNGAQDEMELFIRDADPAALAAGVAVSRVRNLITRTSVELLGGSHRDAAVVRRLVLLEPAEADTVPA